MYMLHVGYINNINPVDTIMYMLHVGYILYMYMWGIKSLATKDIIKCQNGCRKVVNKVVMKILYFLFMFDNVVIGWQSIGL